MKEELQLEDPKLNREIREEKEHLYSTKTELLSDLAETKLSEGDLIGFELHRARVLERVEQSCALQLPILSGISPIVMATAHLWARTFSGILQDNMHEREVVFWNSIRLTYCRYLKLSRKHQVHQHTEVLEWPTN